MTIYDLQLFFLGISFFLVPFSFVFLDYNDNYLSGLRCLPHEPHVKEGPRGLQTKWHLGAFVEEMMVP